MEDRKKVEIEYYDKKAEEFSGGPTSADFEGFNPQNLASFRFLYKLLKKHCQDKVVLDYGCGNGIHSIPLVKMGAEKVVGIDLSEAQISIAKERVKREGMEDKVKFLKMDCEKMEFPDNSFDIIFDGGTFSSLDLDKALSELARVLKPDGFLIGIETLGHNPFINVKRRINKLTGKRTRWAAEHIFIMEDPKKVENYFSKIDLYFFHLISWVAFPFLNLPGGKFMLKLLEKIDRIVLKLPFLRKYAFKVVFGFSQLKKLKIDK